MFVVKAEPKYGHANSSSRLEAHTETTGKTRSALLASCPAPKGLNGAIFPFARATYRFTTTKTLRATLIGACKVQKPERSGGAKPTAKS